MSDSQAAINALNSHTINSKMVWECLERLNELGRNKTVTLLWVPGHTGVEGNEIADALAKKGAETPFLGPEPFCGVSTSTILDKLRKEVNDKRSQYWLGLQELRQAKTLLGNYNQKRSVDCISESKNKLRILRGILTGHCRLRGYLKKLGLGEEEDCRFCEEEVETSIHILSECAALQNPRARYLGDHQIEKEDLPNLKPADILNFLKVIGLEELL